MDRFAAAADLALAETGLDPEEVRAPKQKHRSRPTNAVARLEWAAHLLASRADAPDDARYGLLVELVHAAFEPLARVQRPKLGDLPADPAAILDAIMPPPRFLSREVAIATLGQNARLVQQRLASADPVARIVALRSIGKLGLLDEVARLAASDPDERVRAVAVDVAKQQAKAQRGKLAALLAKRLDDADAAVRAGSLHVLAAIGLPPTDRALELLADRDARVRSAAAAIADPADPAAIQALERGLADTPAVRRAALERLFLVDEDELAGRAGMVPGLRAMLDDDDPELVRSAIYMLGKLGSAARDAALDVAWALPRSANPQQSAGVLAQLDRRDPDVLEALVAHCSGPSTRVAYASAKALIGLGATPPPVPRELLLSRALRELDDPSADVRAAAMRMLKGLAPDGRVAIPSLQALGARVAVLDDTGARIELDAVRETLTALGIPLEELPHAPSRLALYRGLVPAERDVFGAYITGSIRGRVEHGGVGVPTTSMGVWNNTTGEVLFVVDRAELLAPLPDRDEVAVVRTQIEPDARSGGTSRGDLTWWFERYALPSGERRASLAIPRALTRGWPSRLVVGDDRVTVSCGDEDAPYQFEIELGDVDRVVPDKPKKRAATKARKKR